MRRTVMLLFLAAALAVTSLGCGGKTSRTTTIAVVPKGTTHEFWKSVHAGAVKAGRELGVDILWQGPLKEDDREDQIKVVDTLVSRGIDGLVLQDPFAMGYIGVKTFVSHIRGEKVEKFIDTGVAVVTRKNMEQPDIKERLQPDLEKYLKQDSRFQGPYAPAQTAGTRRS